ncbi:GIN domain-containing protein [Cochleicola gelatinilyticus]|uniref:Putative auto-transporter adhesin head GIN domain-containing protein n=1 Tax=Cochleicola gelatinilyticus TaxID=1763537 RepID=A0A167J4U1_9FLAO|nr:DUF2807 domain-containing protein [Cochleicola gelatinilyticus]OAB80339.1 hypothetical protein ULVI_06270 [Cochleicola gelatinilyticus]
MMKKLFLTVIAASITLSCAAQKKPKIKGDRNVTEIEKVIVNPFNTVEIDDGLSVEIKQDATPSYRLKADLNLTEVIEFRVIDSVLKIYTSNRITSSKKLQIELNAPTVQYLILKNDASAKTKGKIEGERFQLTANQSSSFDLDIEAPDVSVLLKQNAGGKMNIDSNKTTIEMLDRTDLKAYIVAQDLTSILNQSAQLTVAGDSKNANYELKEKSELKAKEMKVTSAKLYATNNADVFIHATTDFEIYAEGKSEIYLYGNPEIVIKGLADASRIIKK